ncbi:CDP-alcohol phosphatidyltransferase family protein [Dichotomicrobium thermohalophilum]|uniref:Phosphatidylcholine synthase n=1 Tax=Dichotomicrobium thermohalophilum TaxID=933063 RepID=A0A397PNU4_9HYPH|nr:phosphatidylcholine synthase [Dichotomicrobium thermohalophilum]RIA47411.1 phosphatidylcholine synthase [Dichotomicrobium thermohalophilum]
MKQRSIWPAAAVHIFTATGAVLGFFALTATARGAFETAFLWLGAALLVDGLDGPLARYFYVKQTLPRISGESLDLVIDYMTYVIVPAFMLYEADLVPAGFSGIAAGAIMLTSLFHFADNHSKTTDGFFVGFPALWNLFLLYAFVLQPAPELVLAGVALFSVLTFVPLKWGHPVRVRAFRWVTLTVTAIWSVAAIAVLLRGFPGDLVTQVIFAGAAVYYIALSLTRTAGLAALNETH